MTDKERTSIALEAMKDADRRAFLYAELHQMALGHTIKQDKKIEELTQLADSLTAKVIQLTKLK